MMKLKIFLYNILRFVKTRWVGILVSMGGFLFVSFVAVMFSDSVSMLFRGWFGVGGKKQVLDFLGLGIGGVIALYGLVALNRRAAAQSEQNTLMEKGNYQERFKAAIEHLSSESKENATLRISSFYEFYYLAKDRKDYAQSILDILCAHLRAAANYENFTGENVCADEETKPPEEVKILTGLLFGGKEVGDVFEGLSYDLRQVNLSGIGFGAMRLSSRRILFSNSNLSKTFLAGEDFRNIILQGTNLSGADLEKADLRGAEMYKAVLRKAELPYANLRKAHLWKADLRGANLYCADLQEARLWEANLYEAYLCSADLRGATLSDTDLRYADLSGAYNLEYALLNGARYNDATKFPDDFDPQSKGMKAA